MKLFSTLLIVAALFACAARIQAQTEEKAPDYKIAKIKVTPFDSKTGKFGDELTGGDSESFFNDLSISLLVLIEIDGEAGSFETGRKVNVKVTEGTRVKATVNNQIGLIGEGGKWYEAVWLSPAMCNEITITASITGQKPGKAMTRKVSFMCGE